MLKTQKNDLELRYKIFNPIEPVPIRSFYFISSLMIKTQKMNIGA